MEAYLGNQKINRTFIGTQNIVNIKNMPQTIQIEYVVAAGGGGGARGGAGGGAGGVASGSALLTSHYNATNAYTVTVGAGGISGSISNVKGSNGDNSFFGGVGTFNITAIGGGGGASMIGTPAQASGSNGGSGGGGSSQLTGSIGLGTTSQGNNGGRNGNTGSLAVARLDYQSGGGGGTSQTGSNGFSYYDELVPAFFGVGGKGGAGVTIDWNPINSGRLGDGGGAGENYLDTGFGTRATPGAGGGITATSGSSFPTNATSAVNNGAGGGGGGAAGGVSSYSNGGNGGSGLVLIRYLGVQAAQGGQVSTYGSYTVHTFTSSGQFVF
jgi:hypothetical protein